MKNFNKLFYLFICILLLSACKKDGSNPSQALTSNGASQSLGNGTIHSFEILNPDGTPSTIGLKFTESALTGLTSDSMGSMTPLDLPSQGKITGYDHCEVDWNPYGHEPKAIYGLPHFDFHFYMISKSDQAAVVAGPDTITVPKNFVPLDYISGVVAVPDMGVHWVDSKSSEFNGKKFTDTFIYGFYHGKLTFLEPMITLEFLNSKVDFKINIKQPSAFQKSGYYPTVQHVYYDNSSKEYTIALEGLKLH